MLRVRVLALLLTLVVPACGYGDDPSTASAGPSPSPTFPRATVIIDTGEDSELLRVEVADTEKARRRGLMHRESLGEDEGMVFVYFEDVTNGFYMKNTLIPLSIAFLDVNGRIVRILDMDPCKREPCEIYYPGVPYRAALEVNQGAFEEWGVEEGDRIRLVR